MNIARKPVKSSQLHSIGYDPESKTLEIAFHGIKPKGHKADDPVPAPSVYRYSGVSREEWEKFNKAESHGSHFYKAIKGKFDFQKIS